MINIFFVGGMFGTTLEYMLRNFTKEFLPKKGEFRSDGSMHDYIKECHLAIKDDFKERFHKDVKITTVIYPWREEKLNWIIDNWPGDLNSSNVIFVKAPDIKNAELNMIFVYYKIALREKLPGTLWELDAFCEGNTDNLARWNSKYTTWRDMKTWEAREWLSIFYPDFLSEWINPEVKKIDKICFVNNNDILYNLDREFKRIVNFCNLTLKENDQYRSYLIDWTARQSYILDEFNLLEKIVSSCLSNKEFNWKKLNIISESIIQRRLRSSGYEIKCHNLNEFPTNSKQLYQLLEKI